MLEVDVGAMRGLSAQFAARTSSLTPAVAGFASEAEIIWSAFGGLPESRDAAAAYSRIVTDADTAQISLLGALDATAQSLSQTADKYARADQAGSAGS
jgi:uncharacterized protein YukE